MTASDPRDLRIGDAERDDATQLLQEHLSAGRLDADEFDERVQQALQATHESDLGALFRDLPGRRPGQGMAPAPVQRPLVPQSPIPPIAWWVGTATLAAFTLMAMIAPLAAHHPGRYGHHGRGRGPAADQVAQQGGQPVFWVVLGIIGLVALVVAGVFAVRKIRSRRRASAKRG
ncbi:DUF1707 SHOCT-like domain-containing protein [Enemella evansiae]|uniref:DUF1707 SHOCT-like domain-containing protein n=1 Tax=Enemella evansiae TaxID=2016499 RepID=UPI000B95FC8D|nr:DUF1707 domain-containing protein [Enemella evansiae]OYO01997.1 hypothetical protein CGZ97_16475 [Enemella evansiae]